MFEQYWIEKLYVNTTEQWSNFLTILNREIVYQNTTEQWKFEQYWIEKLYMWTLLNSEAMFEHYWIVK